MSDDCMTTLDPNETATRAMAKLRQAVPGPTLPENVTAGPTRLAYFASRAAPALNAYVRRCRNRDAELGATITFLIADLMHLCDLLEGPYFPFDVLLDEARVHYDADVEEHSLSAST